LRADADRERRRPEQRRGPPRLVEEDRIGIGEHAGLDVNLVAEGESQAAAEEESDRCRRCGQGGRSLAAAAD
jgi:hypothetical protein